MRILFRIGLALLVIGGVFFYLGLKERALASKATAGPEEIPLAKLLIRGADGNPNIVLTQFVPCEDYVYEEDATHWTGAWVPVVPFDKNSPEKIHTETPKNVQALIFTIKARSESELFQRLNRPKIPALVVNNIVSLKSEHKKLLQEKYPETDFEKCLIIQEGREPAGNTQLLAMIGGGGLAAVVGLGLTLFGVAQLLIRR
jgi:hypothetical protein